MERKKALAEEFGAAAGSEENFLHMLDTATQSRPYGFLFVVFGLKIRFFNGYSTEFQVRSQARGSAEEEETDIEQ